jgi:hypothetical protein
LKSLHWLKIPERIEYKVLSFTYNIYTSFLSALVSPPVVHGPTSSFNPFIFHPHTAPPSRHLIA